MDAYISQQKSQLLDSLENQVRFSQLVAVIVGEKGIGKSFLLNQLQKRLEDDVVIASIDAGLALEVPQLEKTISLQLGLSWQGSQISLEDKIKNDLSQKVLISIDNAHLLSNSCIDFILKLNQSQLTVQESALFILLAGEGHLPSLISKTDTYLQHQDMCVVFQIEPINQQEVQSVVETFGNINVGLLDNLYDNKKLEYFWQLSKGNPAELNYHLSRWLDENVITDELNDKSNESSTYAKSAFYVLIAIALILVLVFQNEINHWITTEPPNEMADNLNQNTNTSVSRVIEEPLSKKDHSHIREKVKQKKVDDSSEKNNIGKVGEAFSEELKAPSVTKKELLKLPADEKQEPLLSSIESDRIKQEQLLKKTKSMKETVSAKKAIPDRKMIPKENVIDQSIPILTIEEQNLLTKNSHYFVLQWAGLSQFKTAKEYVKNHPLSNKMSIYRRNNNDKVLFLIISDYFPNKIQADLVKGDYLKQELTDKPWIKSMSVVQSEIKAFQSSKASGKIH